jgi:hypothetical protein
VYCVNFFVQIQSVEDQVYLFPPAGMLPIDRSGSEISALLVHELDKWGVETEP